MLLVFASLPVAVALVTLCCLSWSARSAGLAALATALFLVVLVAPFQMPFKLLATGVAQATPTIFMVLFVLYSGLVLYHLQQRAGALRAIAHAVVRLSPNRERQILILLFGIAPVVESVSGFGLGTVVVLPILLALDLSPIQAATLSLLSQVAIPWGALAVGTAYAAELTHLNPVEIATRTAVITAPLPILYSLVALKFSGGWRAVHQNWVAALTVGAAFSASIWFFSVSVSVELAGCMAGVMTTVLLGAWEYIVQGRRRRVLLARGTCESVLNNQPNENALSWQRAILPHFVLILLLLVTRLSLPVQNWLRMHGTLQIRPLMLQYPILTTPGFWVLTTALAAVPLMGLRLSDLTSAASSAFRQLVPGALAIFCFLETAQIMRLSGMTIVLGAALGGLGSTFCLASPWLAALGGWLTGSNTGSNALFALLQQEAAAKTGLSELWTLAGQNAAGSHAAMVSPARTILASTGARLERGEGILLRTVGPVVLLAVTIIMSLLFFLR